MKKYYINFLWEGALYSVAYEAYNKHQALIGSDRVITDIIGEHVEFKKQSATTSPAGRLLNDIL